jgi:hypothetical protein
MKREIVDALIASLNDPDAVWEYTEYTATNNRIQCEIWLSNGLEWLEVKFWGTKIGRSARKPISYGGECFMLAWLVPWRWRVYRVATAKQVEALAQKAVPDETIVAAIRSASQVPA